MIRNFLVRKREKMQRETQMLKEELYNEQFLRMCGIIERLCDSDEDKGFIVFTIPEKPQRALTSLPFRPDIYNAAECAQEVGKQFADVEGMISAIVDTCVLVCWDETKFDPTSMPPNAYIIYPKPSPPPVADTTTAAAEKENVKIKPLLVQSEPASLAPQPVTQQADGEAFVEIEGSDLQSRAALAEFLIRNGLTNAGDTNL